MTDGPVSLEITAHYEPPKGWGKARRAAAIGGHRIGRGDLDNVIKLVSDALNGIAFPDDANVVEIKAGQIYGSPARLAVTIRALPPKEDREP